jgi:RecA-family ATPase
MTQHNEIRSVTDPLTRLAEKFDCAIVGIRHINKSKGFGDARNAGLNGVGWRAAARSALLVGIDKETRSQAMH